MYESELAPESYKETARQHPRAIPVVSDKHVLPATDAVNYNNKENPLSPTNKLTQMKSNDKLYSPPKNITETSQKLAPALGIVTEKLGPAYAPVAETTHSTASKIPGLTVSSPTEASQTKSSSPLAPQTISSTRTSKPQTLSVHFAPQPLSAPASTTSDQSSFSGPVFPEAIKHVNSSGGGDQQVWDKGVSVKEYLLHKFEPGEDERALSRAISEAISPKKSPGDMSVVDKVREAVSSLLRNDSIDRSPPKPAAVVSSPSKPSRSSPSKSMKLTRSATKSSSQIPISSNAREGNLII